MHVAEAGRLSTTGNPIESFASLGDKIYILRKLEKAIEIYDLATLKLSNVHDIPSLNRGEFMTACERHNLLYIADAHLYAIFRLTVEPDGTLKNLFIFGFTDSPTAISVNSNTNLLVAFHRAGVIGEYTREGTLVRQISLQKNIREPFHAIEISEGEYVVAHYGDGGDTHHVRCLCVVNRLGKIIA